MWKVDYDHLENEPVSVRSVDHEEDVELPFKFKMYDDDDVLYYSGNASSRDDEAAFSPLDDYGAPNAGCTRIDYYNEETKKWETL